MALPAHLRPTLVLAFIDLYKYVIPFVIIILVLEETRYLLIIFILFMGVGAEFGQNVVVY